MFLSFVRWRWIVLRVYNINLEQDQLHDCCLCLRVLYLLNTTDENTCYFPLLAQISFLCPSNCQVVASHAKGYLAVTLLLSHRTMCVQ